MKYQIQTTFSPKLGSALENYCHQTGLDKQSVIKQAVADFLDAKSKQSSMIDLIQDSLATQLPELNELMSKLDKQKKF